MVLVLVLHRTPSKQKSPKKDEDVDIVALLRGHDPKDYERILREHNIHDYRSILQAVEILKKEKEAEVGRPVRQRRRSSPFICGSLPMLSLLLYRLSTGHVCHTSIVMVSPSFSVLVRMERRL